MAQPAHAMHKRISRPYGLVRTELGLGQETEMDQSDDTRYVLAIHLMSSRVLANTSEDADDRFLGAHLYNTSCFQSSAVTHDADA